MRRVLVGVLFVVLAATSVSAGSSEEEARAAYEKGDYTRAAALMRPSAEQGQAWAQFNLGVMHEEGNGVPKDEKEAVAWYRKAAEQGLARAQSNLGFMYEHGKGVQQSYKEAVAWYRKAAAQGEAWAQFNLGLIYRKGMDGTGVERDAFEAADLFQKACEGGLSASCRNIAIAYLRGEGKPQDDSDALKYFRKGCELRNQESCEDYAQLKKGKLQ